MVLDSHKYVLPIDVINLTEAVVDVPKRTIVVDIIKAGWSLNNRFYSVDVLRELAGLLLEKGKMYVNHELETESMKRAGGRDMRDWSAQILETWMDKDTLKAKIHVFEEPDGWLLERIDKFPEEVGISIDAKAIVESTEHNGQDGLIVKKFIRANSADFVPTPAAGGKVVANQKENLIPDDTEEMEKGIKEVGNMTKSEKYSALLQSRIEKSKMSDFLYTLMDTLFSVARDSELSDDEKKTLVSEMFNQVADLVMGLDFAAINFDFYEVVKSYLDSAAEGIFELEQLIGERIDEIEDQSIIEAVMKTDGGVKYPASAYAYVPDPKKPSTWKLRVKNYKNGKLVLDRSQLGKAAAAFSPGGYRGQKVQLPSGDVKKVKNKLVKFYKQLGVSTKEIPSYLLENVNQDGGVDHMTLEELKREHPELVDAIATEVRESIQTEESMKEAKKKLDEISTELESLKKENTSLKESLDKYELKEKIAQKKEKVSEFIKEAKLDEQYVSETFLDSLMEVDDEEKIKEKIQDRVKIVNELESKIKGVGKTDETDTRETGAPTKDDLLKAIEN